MSAHERDAPPGPATGLGFSPRPRLLAAADLVPRGSRVADIGSGHGLLPWLLLASGRAAHCIASEVSPAALARVRSPPLHLPIAQRLELRSGYGLGVLRREDRIDVALILGMGAATIERILDAAADAELALPRFVFQPQTDWAGLRAALLRRGLSIHDERLVRDRGRTYLLLSAVPAADASLPAHPELSPAEVLEVGPVLVHSRGTLVREVWRKELRRRTDISERTTGFGHRAALTALQRARRILRVLEQSGRRRGLI